MYKKIAITNRKLCPDILKQIKKLDTFDYDYIILREKDLYLEEYISLAQKAVNISSKIILHNYVTACENLKYNKIHLPYDIFKREIKRINKFEIVGVSIHSLDEAVEAEKLGTTYITASHIFETQCKEGLAPRGLGWLREICANVNIPVYALGGINKENAQSCIDAGASGICMMSAAMK